MSDAIMRQPDMPFTEEEISLAMSTVMGSLEQYLESIRTPPTTQDCGSWTEALGHKVAEMIISEHAKGHVTY